MKVYMHPASPNCVMVLVTLAHLDIHADIQVVDLFGEENKASAFRAINPNAFVPVIEDDGFVLWETQAILLYLANLKPQGDLLPSNPREMADVSRWQFWSVAHWTPALQPFLFENYFKGLKRLGPPDVERLEKATVGFHALAPILENTLSAREFLVGGSVTLADIAASAWLVYSEEGRMPLATYPHIRRWFSAMCNLRSWVSAAAAGRRLLSA